MNQLRMRRRMSGVSLSLAVLLVTGCADLGGGSQSPTPAGSAQAAPSAANPASHMVKSADGETEGEIVGTIRPSSRFARVRIGMSEQEVENLIGRPNDLDGHITGKAFIPFYFGGDTNRLEAFYKGEGIISYAPTHFAGMANTVVRIIADPTEPGKSH